MKLAGKLFAVKMITVLAIIFAVSFFGSNITAQVVTGGGSSTIQGTIFDKQKNRMSEIDVELLDDYYRTKSRTKTDGAGTYSFSGLPNGRYTIKVYAFRYDLEDQEIPLEINTQNIRGGEGAGYFIQDFYLQPKKGGLRESELSVVFAQEIPKQAQNIYEKAQKDLAEKRTEEGIKGLLEAIKIFPDYYLALKQLGVELYIRGQYSDCARVFLKASEINQKSAVSYYYLGLSFYKLGKDYHKAALASSNKAVVLAPSSPQIFLLIGRIERSLGNASNAEKALLQAKKFSNAKKPDIQMELAELYSNEMKKFKEAADELELYLKAQKLSKDDEVKWKKIIADLREKAKKSE